MLKTDDIRVFELRFSQIPAGDFGLTKEEIKSSWKEYESHVSRTFERILLEKILKKEATVERVNNRKPKLKHPSLFFNKSHSSDIILLAVATTEVGLDIEKVEKVRVDSFKKRILNPNDVLGVDSIESLFECWTLKEAATKLSGAGTTIPFTEIRIEEHGKLESTMRLSGEKLTGITLEVPEDYKGVVVHASDKQQKVTYYSHEETYAFLDL